ncbi:MAG: glycosyltransferase [Magnetococcales bacterium]|nr:glycosyltransferase [Magnetococcales bacterium]
MTRENNDPAIVFVVLNLRMGGQVTAINALITLLKQKGVAATLLLPHSVASADKTALDAYVTLPFWVRLKETWHLLRNIRLKMQRPDTVLHLVLPSPAFSWLVWLVDFPQERILIQYEGAVTRWDQTHRQALWDDPGMLAPRMIINHYCWSLAGRWLTASHLAIGSHAATALKSLGYDKVSTAANLTLFAPEDHAPQLELPVDFDNETITLVGYIGHCFAVKGVDDLLAAFARAANQTSHLRLLLALSGDGNATRIRKAIQHFHIGDKVAILGLVPTQRLLERLDVLVLPYRAALTTTLFPSLLLEADSVGCPVITTAIPEWQDILTPPPPHVTVLPPRDIPALAQALMKVTRRNGQCYGSFLHLPPQEERLEHMRTIYRNLSGMVEMGMVTERLSDTTPPGQGIRTPQS